MSPHRSWTSWLGIVLLVTPILPQSKPPQPESLTEYHVQVMRWNTRSDVALASIQQLDTVDSATLAGPNSRLFFLRMRADRTPPIEAIQTILGRTRIFSLRKKGDQSPTADLIRSAAFLRKNGGLPKADVAYMVRRDPRTKRRLLALTVLGKIRDVYRKGTREPSALAGNQKILGLLPVIDAHIDLVRARGYRVEYEPLESDVGIPNAIAKAIVDIRTKKLQSGIEVAATDSRLRHMYSEDVDQKVIQRQVEETLRHYRIVLTDVIEEVDGTLAKLADRPKTDTVRAKYQALRTTAIGLRSILY